MMTMKKILGGIIVLLFFFGCTEYVPKPRGYFRIDLEEKNYELYQNDDLPCQFEYAKNVSRVRMKGSKQDSIWIDVVYPQLNAKIYCTYKKMNGNFLQLSEEARMLVYKPHTVKADAISESLYQNAERNVYGILYELKGNTASNVQFVVSDSVTHFLRGALYFNSNPNKDSIAPVVNYINEDIIHLVETLRWKKK